MNRLTELNRNGQKVLNNPDVVKAVEKLYDLEVAIERIAAEYKPLEYQDQWRDDGIFTAGVIWVLDELGVE